MDFHGFEARFKSLGKTVSWSNSFVFFSVGRGQPLWAMDFQAFGPRFKSSGKTSAWTNSFVFFDLGKGTPLGSVLPLTFVAICNAPACSRSLLLIFGRLPRAPAHFCRYLRCSRVLPLTFVAICSAPACSRSLLPLFAMLPRVRCSKAHFVCYLSESGAQAP